MVDDTELTRVVADWAQRVVREFDPADPRRSLSRMGIDLVVHDRPLLAAKRQVFGAWDPLLRRVELFGVEAGRPDDELVRRLGHELFHFMLSVRQQVRRAAPLNLDDPQREERLARCFGDTWREFLGAQGVQRCANALRNSARHEPPRAPAHGDSGIIDWGP